MVSVTAVTELAIGFMRALCIVTARTASVRTNEGLQFMNHLQAPAGGCFRGGYLLPTANSENITVPRTKTFQVGKSLVTGCHLLRSRLLEYIHKLMVVG